MQLVFRAEALYVRGFDKSSWYVYKPEISSVSSGFATKSLETKS